MLPVGPQLVVLFALLGGGGNMIKIIQFLELGLGLFVVGIDVGMEFAGELAIGTLDLCLARLALDSENFVVIAKFHPVYSVQIFQILSYYSNRLANQISECSGTLAAVEASFNAAICASSARSSASSAACRLQMNTTYRKIAPKMML